MLGEMPMNVVLPIKGDSNAHQVPTTWRPVLRDVVRLLSEGDYALEKLPLVKLHDSSDVSYLERQITEYGESLVDLPDEAWDTSICLWMDSFWEILVDLWTLEGGRSDLVLTARVYERLPVYDIVVHSIYVP